MAAIELMANLSAFYIQCSEYFVPSPKLLLLVKTMHMEYDDLLFYGSTEEFGLGDFQMFDVTLLDHLDQEPENHQNILKCIANNFCLMSERLLDRGEDGPVPLITDLLTLEFLNEDLGESVIFVRTGAMIDTLPTSEVEYIEAGLYLDGFNPVCSII